jgi:intein/homing endonuclease
VSTLRFKEIDPMMESSVSSVSSVPPDFEPITKTIRKRDGVTVQSFDVEKIRQAIGKAWLSEYSEIDRAAVEKVIRLVVTSIEDIEVTVEGVQDRVEIALMRVSPKVAKHYIIYREERAKKRALVSKKPDPKAVSDYIHAGKYARHRADLGRREVYAETVDRDKDMHIRKFPELRDQIEEAFGYVHRQQILPSMRSLENSTPIPTPDGWKSVGEIQVGDMIFDSDGRQTKVLRLQKFQDIELYDVFFSDGSVLRASADHLWVTSTLDDRIAGGRTRTVTTEQIVKTLRQGSGSSKYPWKYNHAVWNPKPIHTDAKVLPLDPYILGLWLGDGYSHGGQFACDQKDAEIPEAYAKAGFPITAPGEGNPYAWGTHGLAIILRKMNLRDNKHVPIEYLRASFEQRLALVQGLMDSDGTTTPEGRSQFANTNPKLLDPFCELLSSLGIKYVYSDVGRKEEHHKDLHLVSFFTSLPVHRLSRKIANIRDDHRASNTYRTIVAVELVERGDATCFLVDAESHTYLAGRQMIVTHNSMQFGGLAIEVCHPRQYNCSFTHIDRLEAFSQSLYLLLCGCGVGYSVQYEHVEKLPSIGRVDEKKFRHHVIEDTIEGWGNAAAALFQSFQDGVWIEFAFHKIRDAGSILKTSGGRAPGHAQLKKSLEGARSVLLGAQGRQLRPIEAHRLMCIFADAPLSGGIRRCLPAGTLVHTARGLVPIEQVKIGDRVRTSGVKHDAWGNVSEVIEQGMQSLVHIKTQMGVFKCTSKHRMAVMTSPTTYEFKMARDLEEGDRLVFVEGAVGGRTTQLPKWKYTRREADKTSVDITIPNLNVDVAWFIGLLHGDGYVHVNRTDRSGGGHFVALAMNELDSDTPEMVRRCRDVLSRFGVSVDDYVVKGENTRVVRSPGKQLALYFENFKKPNEPLRVPDFILQGTKEIRSAYLAGLLDSDGGAGNRPVLLVGSVYLDFLRQVQVVYASLGIPTRITMNREARGNWQAMYHLSLVGELPRATFKATVEQESVKKIVDEYVSQRDYGYPREWILGSGLEFGRDWSPQRKQMTIGTFDRCGGKRENLIPITIFDVEETDETAETYDLTVDDAHEFVAGGLLVHNSAMIALFSPDDSEMRDCKTGNWFEKEGYFKNANNSAVYLRNEAGKKLFFRNIQATKYWGDPGFYFTWDLDYGANPCVPAGTRILTREGYRNIESLVGQRTAIWNGVEWCDVTPQVTGHDQLMVRVSLSDGTFLNCTEAHTWCIATGKWSRNHVEERVKARDLDVGDVLMRYDMPVVETGKLMPHAYTHGFYCADGCLEDAGRKAAYLYGIKQGLVKYLDCDRVGEPDEELDRTRVVFPEQMPDKFVVPFGASVRSRLDWFAGVLDGDGAVVRNPKSVNIQLPSINLTFLRDVRLMLTTLGVQAKIALAREEGMTLLPDGRGGEKEYLTQDCYRLLINATDTHRLVVLGLKTHRLDLTLAKEKPQRDARRFVTVVSVEKLPRAKTVYCFTEEKNHTGTFEGIVTGQCVEIGLHPILVVDDVIQARLVKKGIIVEIGSRHSGFAFCNLTTINAAKFKSADDFMAAAKAATFIGTLQASYTTMPYLGWVSEAIAERDALLGVSMTGMLDAPEISCNPTLQRNVARRVKEWNREFAELLGIEPAARTTCVKPEGTASLELGGVATGQHGHHAKRYFKRIIANEHEFIFQEFKKVNPHMCVRKPDGEWVIEFPVEAPAGAILKGDLGAVEFLRMGLSTQKNWIIPGLADDRYSPRLHHNVSITVQVKPEEWDPVAEFIWANREYFTGVSLFPSTGDKDFAFAPNEEVLTDSDEARWADLVSKYTPVDYAAMVETEDGTDLKGEVACAGGACAI